MGRPPDLHDPAAIQAALEGLIPGCGRSNPRLFHRLPGELRPAEVTVSAAPLYPDGYVLLTDERLLAFDRPVTVVGGDLCEAVELAAIDGLVRALSRHSTDITLTLDSAEQMTLTLGWGGRRGDEFAQQVSALARAASGKRPVGAPAWAPPRPGPPPPPTTPAAPSMVPPPPSLPEARLIPSSRSAATPHAGAGSAASTSPSSLALEEALTRADDLLPEAASTLKALRRERDARNERIRSRTKAVDEASRGKKLRAIGAVQRVVLYEDRVVTPDGTFELGPNVHARCELQGAVQSVQGWVWKSDQDRREVYLHVNGPGWHSVIRWNLKWTANQPKPYIEMAYAIGQAANQASELRAAIEQRLHGAEDDLLSELGDLAGVEAISARLDPLESGLLATKTALETAMATDGSGKRAAGRRAGAAAMRCGTAVGELNAERDRIAETRRYALDRRTEVEREREERSARIAASGPLNPADPAVALTADATPPPAEPLDLVSALERLAALHAKGLLTDEEFGTAKGELLRGRAP